MSDKEIARILTMIANNISTDPHRELSKKGNLPSVIIAGTLIEIKLALIKTASQLYDIRL